MGTGRLGLFLLDPIDHKRNAVWQVGQTNAWLARVRRNGFSMGAPPRCVACAWGFDWTRSKLLVPPARQSASPGREEGKVPKFPIRTKPGGEDRDAQRVNRGAPAVCR